MIDYQALLIGTDKSSFLEGDHLMTKESNESIQTYDLLVVQYLNERITFDLLATLEDGFSQVKTIETQDADSSEAGSFLQGGVNLLGIALGGRRTELSEGSRRDMVKEELIHTPASLFARLRSELKAKGLVRKVIDTASFHDVKTGDFVKFEAILQRVDISEFLRTFEIIAPLGALFDERPSNASKGKQGRAHRNNDQQSDQMSRQVKAVQFLVSGDGSRDLVARVAGMKFMLTVDRNCFVDPTMNDVLDGTFRIFGKVTRVVEDDSDSINLFRMSPLSNFSGFIEQLVSGMEGAIGEVRYQGKVSETEIAGPTLQVIPIGIFA